MGKGMIALDPFANRSIISLPVVAGLSAMLIALTNAKHCECSRSCLLLG
jgi:hypothetical protein